MANNPLQWSGLGSAITGLLSSSSSTGLMSLSTGCQVRGDEWDNTAQYQYGDLVVRARGAAAFAAGDYLAGWLLRSNGGVYEDGITATSSAPARAPDFTVPLRAVAVQQILIIGPVLLPNCPTRMLVQNLATKALTTSTGENGVTIIPYNDNLVSA